MFCNVYILLSVKKKTSSANLFITHPKNVFFEFQTLTSNICTPQLEKSINQCFVMNIKFNVY